MKHWLLGRHRRAASWTRALAVAPLLVACSTSSTALDEISSNDRIEGGTRITASLRTGLANKFVCAENAGGGVVNADRDAAREWETFTLIDQNGGALESGDTVFLQTFGGYYVQAVEGGGGAVVAANREPGSWETFRIEKEGGGGVIKNGDVIGLKTTTGAWVSAKDGGGGAVLAYGAALGPWERFTLDLKGADTPPTPPPTPPPNPPTGTGDWKLVWADEFNDGDAPSTAAWRYDVQKPGWVNHELQNYTDARRENSRIENDALVIEGRRDYYQNFEYSSARLNSKQSFLYGRVEVRAKLPFARGTWPAIWMMPDDMSRGWPRCGEIDIMEHVGYDPGKVHATVHTGKYNWPMNTQKGETADVPTATSEFHVYRLDWYPDRLEAYVDGRRYFEFRNEGNDDAWPYNKPFHVILNLAIGGDWGGVKGVDANAFPQRMEVDYVRVYQQK